MGKKIRHLEFYGYTDQNVYMGLPNVDLSDIRETNKEQDKEINAISGATSGKADKATVDSLSGKVDTFMDKQDKINKWLAKGINKNRERIDKLESRDGEITDKINEIVDDFNPIYNELGNLSSKIDSDDFETKYEQDFDGLIRLKRWVFNDACRHNFIRLFVFLISNRDPKNQTYRDDIIELDKLLSKIFDHE